MAMDHVCFAWTFKNLHHQGHQPVEPAKSEIRTVANGRTSVDFVLTLAPRTSEWTDHGLVKTHVPLEK